MAWTIVINNAAKKELSKLDKNTADWILQFLEEKIATDENPRRFGSHLRQIWQDYRDIASETFALS